MKEDWIRTLEERGAILRGHFLLTSGLHAPVYVEKFRILEDPELLSAMVAQHRALLARLAPQVVAGPTTGGVLVAYEVARQLRIWAYYAERDGEKRVFRRGFVFTPGMRVLLADDVLTTGSSLLATKEALPSGVKVVGAFVLVDRRPGDAPEFPFPLVSAVRMPLAAHPPDRCPLCARGIPLSVRGKGTA